MGRKIKNLEFAVQCDYQPDRYFDTFTDAAEHAVVRAIGCGSKVYIDVLASTRAAAKQFGIEEHYDSDPDASVTCRIEIRANDLGHVP